MITGYDWSKVRRCRVCRAVRDHRDFWGKATACKACWNVAPSPFDRQTCLTCQKSRPLTQFAKGGQKGLTRQCHKCEAARYRRYYQAVKEKRVTDLMRRRVAHPERDLARAHVAVALADGRLRRQACWVCGATAEPHHPCYDEAYRLDVVWLCRSHHRQTHALLKFNKKASVSC